jgi:hypothetical protein
VPPVSPDDDWDWLDVEQVFDSQLPPRRSNTPRTPKMDVNLTGFKSIETARHAGATNATGDKASSKAVVSVSIHGERAVVEKEDFQAALVMEIVKLDHGPAQSYQRSMKRRFTPGERDDWGLVRHKGSARWMLYVALGVICLIALTIFLSQFAAKKSVRKSDQAGLNQIKPVDVKSVPAKELGPLGKLVNRNKQAIQIYGQYAQAEKPEDISKWIYLSNRNLPLAKDTWNPVGVGSGWKPSDTAVWKAYQNGKLVFAELRGVHQDFSKFLAVFRYEHTELKMDWKATTGYGTAGFDELKTGQGDGREIRGWIARSDFFTQTLSDDRYHSFILRSPDNEASIWVYTEIGSEVDKGIMALFATSRITGEYQTEAKVILNLERGEQGILPVQWMIRNLIAANWLDQATP